MKTKIKPTIALVLFIVTGFLSHGQIIINAESYQGSYEVYNLYGQKIYSGEGKPSDAVLPSFGTYVLKFQDDLTGKITTNLDGEITSFKVVTRDDSRLDVVKKHQILLNLNGDPLTRTKPVMVDSVDLSSLSSDRSLESFTYCDSIPLNRREIPDFGTSWDQLQVSLAAVPTDWQKYEVVSAWVYRTSDFKSDESDMAMDWFTWRDSMDIEERYEYSRRDSGTVLCGNRAEQLSQILRDSFGVTNRMLYSLNGIHTVLLVQTSAGVWMLDPYYSSSYAEVRPMQQYGQIMSEEDRTYPIDFLSYLRKAKGNRSDLRVRQIPKSFGICDDIKDSDTLQLLTTDCDLLAQYLNNVGSSQNPICDTCTGANMSIWLPQRYCLTNEESPYNFKVLDDQNFVEYSQSGALPVGVTAETLFAYTGNGINFGIYPDADPAWTQGVILEISNILNFTP